MKKCEFEENVRDETLFDFSHRNDSSERQHLKSIRLMLTRFKTAESKYVYHPKVDSGSTHMYARWTQNVKSEHTRGHFWKREFLIKTSHPITRDLLYWKYHAYESESRLSASGNVRSRWSSTYFCQGSSSPFPRRSRGLVCLLRTLLQYSAKLCRVKRNGVYDSSAQVGSPVLRWG